jgi:hypothetical protein
MTLKSNQINNDKYVPVKTVHATYYYFAHKAIFFTIIFS